MKYKENWEGTKEKWRRYWKHEYAEKNWQDIEGPFKMECKGEKV